MSARDQLALLLIGALLGIGIYTLPTGEPVGQVLGVLGIAGTLLFHASRLP